MKVPKASSENGTIDVGWERPWNPRLRSFTKKRKMGRDRKC